MMHSSIYPDMLLHTFTLLVSTFLFTLSFLSYKRKQNEKFKYITGAFGLFAFKETVMLVNLLTVQLTAIDEGSHLITLLILLMFYRGTTR